jgi:acyl-CoA synthetase (NDP forming)
VSTVTACSSSMLAAAGIPLVEHGTGTTREEVLALAREHGFSLVLKVVGPVHKSDVSGVTLNIKTTEHLLAEFDRMMCIPASRR